MNSHQHRVAKRLALRLLKNKTPLRTFAWWRKDKIANVVVTHVKLADLPQVRVKELDDPRGTDFAVNLYRMKVSRK